MEEKSRLKNECIVSREASDVAEVTEEDPDLNIADTRLDNTQDDFIRDLRNIDHVLEDTTLGDSKLVPSIEADNVGSSRPTESTGHHSANMSHSTLASQAADNMKPKDSINMQKETKYADINHTQAKNSGDAEDNLHVLDPENPLMIKFQSALKELLQKQLLKLNEEVAELNSTFKSKATQREDLGVHLFNLQEEVNHTQKQLDVYNKTLLELEERRRNIEDDLKKTRGVHKEEMEKIHNIQAQEENMRLEIEALKSIENQLKKWELDYNSELTISQGIADKTEKQKEEMSKEKQKQDILLLKLRQAVLSLESKQEQFRAQREVKLIQQESLRRTIAEASADLEALQSEQVRLTRIWNGVVISLQQRDRVYNNVQKDLQQAKEAFHLMLSEIESYKRIAKLEMLQSEKTMNILNRLEMEYSDLEKAFNRNKDSVLELEADYSYCAGIVKQTEENLHSVILDGKLLSQQSMYQQKEFELLTQKKISLERQILEKLLDQSKHDKELQHNACTIQALKDSNKNQEMAFIMMENQIAKTMVEVQKTQGSVVYNESLLTEATDEVEKLISELSQLEAEVKRSTTAMENKMRLIDQLSKKLESILAQTGTSEESPQEIRIKAIEVEVEETTQEAEKKQAFWLRLQSHIVRLTEERQRQVQQLNLLYKQIHILTQRALKIGHETEKHTRGKKDVGRLMHDLEVSLHKMTVGLHDRRGYKEILDKENVLLQTESLKLLKDLEKENVEYEEEITNLEENNMMLNQEILDLKRDCLAWEKKILMVSETKQMNDDDNKATGELTQMKVEIHRMDVRFSHLRKVQETLVKDLEHCIMRRESLLDEADAREKRSMRNFGSVSNRIVFERKLENLSNRTKQAKMETKSIVSQLENELPQELAQLRASIKEIEDTLRREEQAVADGRSKVDEAHLRKQQKLEMLVRLQKKVRLYTKVREGKHKLLYRAESVLDGEMCKQRAMTSDLVELVGVLQQHFPPLNLQILRLQNILQALIGQ